MRIIAVTGGIASGKSLVLKLFKEEQIPTIDCDAIVQQLHKRKAIKQKILRAFSSIDKKALASIIFSSAQKRKQLESILHPPVLSELQKKLRELEKHGEKLVVVDIPLLFEKHLEKVVDLIIVVKVTKAQQMARLLKQGLSKKEAEQRIKAQLPLKEKIKKADYVIDNTLSIDFAKEQVLKIIRDMG